MTSQSPTNIHCVADRYLMDQRERVVDMVLENAGQYGSIYAACKIIAPAFGVDCKSLCCWVIQEQINARQRPSSPSVEQHRITKLELEVQQLKEANELLRSHHCTTCRPAKLPDANPAIS